MVRRRLGLTDVDSPLFQDLPSPCHSLMLCHRRLRHTLSHHGALRLGLLKAVAYRACRQEQYCHRSHGHASASLAASHEAQVLGSLLLLPPIAAILLQELFYIVYLIHLTFAFVIVNKLGT